MSKLEAFWTKQMEVQTKQMEVHLEEKLLKATQANQLDQLQQQQLQKQLDAAVAENADLKENIRKLEETATGLMDRDEHWQRTLEEAQKSRSCAAVHHDLEVRLERMTEELKGKDTENSRLLREQVAMKQQAQRNKELQAKVASLEKKADKDHKVLERKDKELLEEKITHQHKVQTLQNQVAELQRELQRTRNNAGSDMPTPLSARATEA